MMARQKTTYYAVYLRKTDELICSGNAAECAAAMGRSEGSFRSLVSKVCNGLNRKYEVYKEQDSELEV